MPNAADAYGIPIEEEPWKMRFNIHRRRRSRAGASNRWKNRMRSSRHWEETWAGKRIYSCQTVNRQRDVALGGD